MSLSSVADTQASHRSNCKNFHFFSLEKNDSDCSSPVQLCDIHRFVKLITRSIRKCGTRVFVACAKPADPILFTNTALMLGSYLILTLGMEVEHVSKAFRPAEHLFVKFSDTSSDVSVTIVDCWHALYRIRNLGWVDVLSEIDLAPESARTSAIDMDEYNHYIDPANGGLHIIAPGRLLFIPSPVDIPDGRDWMDTEIGRRFSPIFFADLLAAEFRTALVISLSHEKSDMDYDTSAFEERGIAMEVISMGPNGSPHHLLAAADRLLELLRAAPGAVAVHVQGPGACGGGSMGVLLATGLIRIFGFSAGEAAAWLRMVCPPLHVPHAQLSAIVQGRSGIATEELESVDGGLARSFSLPLPLAATADTGGGGGGAERPAWAAAQNPLLRTFSSPLSS